jgi:hypothetical protein
MSMMKVVGRESTPQVLRSNLFKRRILDRVARSTSRIGKVQDCRLAKRVPIQTQFGTGQPPHHKPSIQSVGEIPEGNNYECDKEAFNHRSMNFMLPIARNHPIAACE